MAVLWIDVIHSSWAVHMVQPEPNISLLTRAILTVGNLPLWVTQQQTKTLFSFYCGFILYL